MRRMICLMVLIMLLAACGGVENVNTGITIPAVDASQANDASYSEGWNRLKAGDPKGALTLFQNSRMGDEKLFVGYGFVYLLQNKLNLAQRNFEKTLELNPRNLNAQLGLAAMYEQLNESEPAFRMYASILTTYPENSWAKVRYDFIRTTQTQKYLELAQQIQAGGDRQRYIDALRKASAYSPDLPEIQVQIADFHAAELRYDEAARYYENILTKQPNRVDILEKAASVYEKAKRYDAAIILYNRLLEIKPGEKTYVAKVNELKILFSDMKLPEKFKRIFFKTEINREELAALVGYYFDRYLDKRSPVIITDIGGSFAQNEIIRVCTLGIMNVRPDHSFDRFPIVSRAAFATVIDNLLRHLQKEKKLVLRFLPPQEVIEPRDISSLHKQYSVVKFLLNAQLIMLDADKNFDPTRKITPSEVLGAIRSIVNSIGE